ncbi:NAD-glutamate dehydrogenase [Gaopeijia maritima]|uniref:NAD-glutamate dehydrogenase n=1 Tax=Gaopeijia maritima TaxID=3119007 RepID=A0ABU9E7A8_9BACT
MSDTTEAAVRRIRQDSPTVDAVCRQLEAAVDGPDAPQVVAFAEIFFSKATADFINERSTDALAKLVLGTYRFLEASMPDRVDVEVFNPDVDNEGWYAPVTVIRTNISERPFVVDTIREYLHSQDLPIEHNVYPVLHVERAPEGGIAALKPSSIGGTRESLVHCEVARVADEATMQAIKGGLETRLRDVKRATDDFHPMIRALDATLVELDSRADALSGRTAELEEVRSFLHWLKDEAFVFLGYRGYDVVERDGVACVQVTPGSGLGILRDEGDSAYAAPVPLDQMAEGMRELVLEGPLLIISKTNAESTVHRRARMDYIGVKKVGHDGRVLGEHRFVGLFTSKAFGEQAERIPILREKLQKILDDAAVAKGSHDYKEINTIFNSMPKEELFLTSAEEIGRDIRTVLTSYHSDGVRVTLRNDTLRRGISVMVILPKERFSAEARRRIAAALTETFEGEVLNYHLALGAGDQARLHFYLAGDADRLDAADPVLLEGRIHELIRTWSDRVREGLERVRPADEARRLSRRYGESFSPEYQASSTPGTAVRDILALEAMSADGRTVSVAFNNPVDALEAAGDEPVTELKLYLRGERLILSDFMPILENCGLRVVAVSPFELDGPDVERALLYAFALQDADGAPLDVEAVGTLLSQTVLAVRDGRVSSDVLNGLVVKARLHWRDVDVLRTYADYAFQAGAVPSRISVPAALVKYPDIASLLVSWFQAKFDPGVGSGMAERASMVDGLRARFQAALRSVELLADDRALRRIATLIDATVRTNYYRAGGRVPTRLSGGVPYTSLKFASRALESIQRTRLTYEVYVRSSRMEGVHLRGATVARGGIRWSDRPDDFRTEVLGLVKTQMVKNAVIVPGGSKGGFVPTRLPADPESRGEEAKEQYRTLIRGLLDLTDNLDTEGQGIPPEHVLAWDDPDPYLVVAADKGTAKFSDVANAVADDYGFWLGDAFASGGSYGYDHKKVGITARGAWESVKRHFSEIGKDVQSEPFTVVGIGDMSGDVFGNGMLLSEQIKLVAAFDHRHVFIDPDPDPASTFAERQRMFALGRSSWEDYDESLLSEGGMIVPRGAKEVVLTPQARAVLGLPDDLGPLDGESLIRTVLQAPVELLWNGGIGTYVKASSETHTDAGDPSNDAVRVDASELRCAVVGEGGNLGFTQAARVEYALAGGRINTDALDNSGGVALSDREVNLKILLGPSVRSGSLGAEERNTLLEALTDDVADRVLRDNWSQSLAVSLDRMRQADQLDEFRDLMTALERGGLLDRASEGLPTLEVLVERAENGGDLTRPELCVLLAYAKLAVKSATVASGLPDEPSVERYLTGYFPVEAIRKAGREHLVQHPLRREIITSQVTNDLVDLMGATFVHRLTRDTGATADEVVRAWVVASRLADHRRYLGEMTQGAGRSLRTMDAYRWVLGLSRVLERTTRWALKNVSATTDMQALVSEYQPGLEVLRREFGDLVTGDDRVLFEKLVGDVQELGGELAFARELISLRFLDQMLEILRVARDTGGEPADTARAFYRVSELLGVPWLREAIFASANDDRWEQRAAQALADDLTRAHHRLVSQVMREKVGGLDAGDVAQRLIQERRRDVERYRHLLDEIRADDKISLSGLSVAVREVTELSERVNLPEVHRQESSAEIT